MENTLRKSFGTHPVELTVGILVVVLGVVLAGQDGWLQWVGGVFAAVGSFLTSWVMASTRTSSMREEQLYKSVDQVNVGLARLSSEISAAARDGSRGKSDPMLAFAVIKQSASGLFGLSYNLQQMTQRKIQSSELVDNTRTLVDLSQRLERITSLADGSLAKDEIEEVHSQLKALLQRVGESDNPMVTERVTCPNCLSETACEIGILPTDSAIPTCNSCGNRFHLHRLRDGDLTVRPYGGEVVAMQSYEIECPNGGCGNRVKMKSAEGETEAKVRFCFNCFARLEIDPVKRSVIRFSAAEPLKSRITKVENGKYVLHCSVSDTEIRSFYLDEDKELVFGVCYHCEPAQLIVGDVEGYRMAQNGTGA